MRRINGATLSVVGGVLGALVVACVAGATATGCGGDDNGGGNNTSSSNTSTTPGQTSSSSKSSTSGATSSTSGSSSSTSSSSSSSSKDGGGADADAGGDGGDATLNDGDAGSDADAAPANCNTAAMLLGDGGTLLFSFDDGGVQSWSLELAKDPADAGFDAAIANNPTMGNTCPGSLEATLTYSTTGQTAGAQVFESTPGLQVTGTAVHMSVKLVIPGDTDGGEYTMLGGPINGVFGNVQPFIQYTLATPDGAVPFNDAGAITYQSGNFNTNLATSSFANGAWQNVSVSFTPDGGPATAFLNHVVVQLYTPAIVDAGIGPTALANPVTVQLLIDDVYVQ